MPDGDPIMSLDIEVYTAPFPLLNDNGFDVALTGDAGLLLKLLCPETVEGEVDAFPTLPAE